MSPQEPRRRVEQAPLPLELTPDQGPPLAPLPVSGDGPGPLLLIFWDGYECRYHNGREADCPHPEGSAEYEQWRAGYRDCERVIGRGRP